MPALQRGRRTATEAAHCRTVPLLARLFEPRGTVVYRARRRLVQITDDLGLRKPAIPGASASASACARASVSTSNHPKPGIGIGRANAAARGRRNEARHASGCRSSDSDDSDDEDGGCGDGARHGARAARACAEAEAERAAARGGVRYDTVMRRLKQTEHLAEHSRPATRPRAPSPERAACRSSLPRPTCARPSNTSWQHVHACRYAQLKAMRCHAAQCISLYAELPTRKPLLPCRVVPQLDHRLAVEQHENMAYIICKLTHFAHAYREHTSRQEEYAWLRARQSGRVAAAGRERDTDGEALADQHTRRRSNPWVPASNA